MERILVGVDGSSASFKAVDFAADLANKYNAELILLTVVPHFSPEVDPALEAYARVEHIQAPATDLALAATKTVLDGARRRARAGSRPSRLSVTLPKRSLRQPGTARPISSSSAAVAMAGSPASSWAASRIR